MTLVRSEHDVKSGCLHSVKNNQIYFILIVDTCSCNRPKGPYTYFSGGVLPLELYKRLSHKFSSCKVSMTIKIY